MRIAVINVNDDISCKGIYYTWCNKVFGPVIFIGRDKYCQEKLNLLREIFRVKLIKSKMKIQLLYPKTESKNITEVIQFEISSWGDFKDFFESRPPWWDSLFYDVLSRYVDLNNKSLDITKPGRFTL